MKRLLSYCILVTVAWCLPTVISAQTYTRLVAITELDGTTLEWLRDYYETNNEPASDYYVLMKGTQELLDGTIMQGETNGYFFPDAAFRANIRKWIQEAKGRDKDYPKIYRDDFISYGDELYVKLKSVLNFKGIEYFHWTKRVLICMDANGNRQTKGAGSVKLNLEGMKNLETLQFMRDYNGNTVTASYQTMKNYLGELNISDTKITTLDLSGYNYLTSLKANNSQLSSLTLPSASGNALQTLQLNNTSVSSLTLTTNTALADLRLDGNTSITSLDVSKNINLAYFSCNGATNLTTITWQPQEPNSPVTDLYIDVRNSGIGNTESIHKTHCIAAYQNLAEFEGHGAEFTCYAMNGVWKRTMDADALGTTTADASVYPAIRDLTLIGMTDFTLPNDISGRSNEYKVLRLDITESPDLPKQKIYDQLDKWKDHLLELTFVDHNPSADQEDLDFSFLTALKKLTIEGETKSLIPPAGITHLTARETGLESVNLSALTNLEELDFTDSDELEHLTMPESGKLNLKKLVLAGCRKFSNFINDEFGGYNNLEYIDISRTEHRGNYADYTDLGGTDSRVTTDVGYQWNDDGTIKLDPSKNNTPTDGVPMKLNTLDLRHLKKLQYLNVAMCPIEFLNLSKWEVDGVTGIGYNNGYPEWYSNLKTLILAPDPDYKGHNNFYNNTVESVEPLKEGDTAKKLVAEATDGTRLIKIDISGCTGLQDLQVSYPIGTDLGRLSEAFQYNKIRDIRANCCIVLDNIHCYNSDIERIELDVDNSLRNLSLINGKMTSEAMEKSYYISNGSITQLVLHRNKLDNVRFITSTEIFPSLRDVNGEYDQWPQANTVSKIKKIKHLQLNGGSYVRRYNMRTETRDVTDEHGNTVTESYDAFDWCYVSDRLITNTISEIDLTNLTGLTGFFIADNLIRTLNIPEEWKTNPINQMEVQNNRMTQQNFSNISAKALLERPSGHLFNWKHQVTFREFDVRKGGVELDGSGNYVREGGYVKPGKIREDGENDVILLNLPFAWTERVGGEGVHDADIHNEDDLYYAVGHQLQTDDGDLDLISMNENVLDENGNIVYEDDGVTPKKQVNYYLKTHSGLIHQSGDIDLHRKVLHYHIPTSMDMTGVNYGDYSDEDGEPLFASEEELEHFGDLEVKIHTEPYVVYVNPLTRSGAGVDYFSSTVCLSYQWEVPEGLEAYIITGLTEDGNSIYNDKDNVEGAMDYRLNTVKIGDAGDIIPKNTPVYLRTVPAFKDVVTKEGDDAVKYAWNETDKKWETTTDDDGLSHVAGFYAMHKNWEPEYIGWENDKGITDELARLYITKNGPTKATILGDANNSAKYVTVNKEAVLLTEEILKTNLLRCDYTESQEATDATYYDSFEADHKYHYTFDYQNLPKWKCLTLGREKKQGTGMIGFWAYTGTKIDPHRCYILGDELLATLPAEVRADADASSIGYAFHFEADADYSVLDIKPTANAKSDDNSWYTLAGARLSDKPVQSGVYIHKGKKVYVK